MQVEPLTSTSKRRELIQVNIIPLASYNSTEYNSDSVLNYNLRISRSFEFRPSIRKSKSQSYVCIRNNHLFPRAGNHDFVTMRRRETFFFFSLFYARGITFSERGRKGFSCSARIGRFAKSTKRESHVRKRRVTNTFDIFRARLSLSLSLG